MDDDQIVELYWERSEAAIAETSKKYGRYCHFISNNILHNSQDADECVNDTFLRAWNAIPPNKPNCLCTFLGKITRNLSFNKYKSYSAEKRGGSQTALSLSELEECIPVFDNVEQVVEKMTLDEAIHCFLAALPKTDRVIFMRRYWYLCSIKEISRDFNMNENTVKSILFNERKRLKAICEKEGILL